MWLILAQWVIGKSPLNQEPSPLPLLEWVGVPFLFVEKGWKCHFISSQADSCKWHDRNAGLIPRGSARDCK